jgi:hypothetical protein
MNRYGVYGDLVSAPVHAVAHHPASLWWEQAASIWMQYLGQLSERLSYDRLYQDAVRDPRLARTRQELEVAVDNARAAREVV